MLKPHLTYESELSLMILSSFHVLNQFCTIVSFSRGFVALGQNAFSDAHEFFKEAVNEDPSNPVVSLLLSNCHSHYSSG